MSFNMAFRSMPWRVLVLLALVLLCGCSSLAPKDQPPDVILAQKIKSSQNACIRLRQAEEEAASAGLADAQGYREARERACQQYEQEKRELERYQSQSPLRSNQTRQP
jgi:hypothetical protein